MTHPFHPWFGEEFEFVAVQRTWGEDRVFFFAGDGTKKSLPRAWTSESDPDPFVVVAAGRSRFRVEDLVALAEILQQLPGSRRRRTVKTTSPVVSG